VPALDDVAPGREGDDGHLVDTVQVLTEPGCAYVQGGEPPARSWAEKTCLNGERRWRLAEGESHDVTVAGRTKRKRGFCTVNLGEDGVGPFGEPEKPRVQLSCSEKA
jgi:hypothetical protein